MRQFVTERDGGFGRRSWAASATVAPRERETPPADRQPPVNGGFHDAAPTHVRRSPCVLAGPSRSTRADPTVPLTA